MSWFTAGRGLMGRASPHHPYNHHHHHHHHHHFHHRGVLSSGGASCTAAVRRSRYFLVLLVLAGVLVVNMLLLVPRLHANAPSSSSSSDDDDDSSIGLQLKGLSAAAPPPAATAAHVSTAEAAKGGGQARRQQQQQQQQRRQQRSGEPPTGEFMHDFDANKDGVLGPAEFQTLMQEACRNDRSALGMFSWLARLMRLGVGLRPQYAPAGPYPCSLRSDLADATRQAAVALSFSTGRSSRQGGTSSSSSSQGRGSRGLRDELRADTAAGAAAVDPDSPEGQAAAQRASLLARCAPLSQELAAAAASHGTLLLVAADWGMFELFGVNWLAHVQRSGVDNYLMAALDQKTADFLTSNKLGHCISWNPSVPGGGEGMLPPYSPPAAAPSSKQHAVLSWSALQVAQVALGWEYDVILSHLDAVWLTDPLPYLQAHVPAAADVVFSTEAPAAAAVMGSRSAGLLVNPPADPAGAGTGAGAAGHLMSMGVAYIRGTPQGQAAVAAWVAAYEAQVAQAQADAAAAADDAAVSSSSGRMLAPVDVVNHWLSGEGGLTGGGSSSSSGAAASAAVKVQGPHPSQPKVLLLVGPNPGLFEGLLFGSARRRLARSAGVGVFSPVAVSNSYSWFVQGVGWRAAAVVARSSSSAASGRKLPLAVHVGGGHSSREGRLHQLREAQWYADGPKYYSEPKLLSFDLQPYTSPQVTAGLANAPDFSQGEQLALHIASLSHQLQQFYAGAAVAAALGRVLVLPTFQCYCFRDPGSGPGGPGELSWGSSSSGSDSSSSSSSGSGWACRAPGDDNSVFPFNCTLDQVMDPAALYAHNPAFAGHPLMFREAPFLHNARSPSWIRHAATTISSGAPLGCRDSSSSTPPRCAQVLQSKPPTGVNQEVIVPPGLTDVSLSEVLEPFAAAKWLHFTDVTAVFGGFADPAHKAEYEAWLDKVVLPWCCKPAGGDQGGGGGGGSASRSGGGDEGNSMEDFAAAGVSDVNSALPPLLLEGVTELPTAAPGWVMVDVKARGGGGTTPG